MIPRVYRSKIITKDGHTVKTNLNQKEVVFYRKLLRNFDSDFNYKKDSSLSLNIWLSQKVGSIEELVKIFKKKGIIFGYETKEQGDCSSKIYRNGYLKIEDDHYLFIPMPKLGNPSIKINIKTGGRFIGRKLTDKMRLDVVNEQLKQIKKYPSELIGYLELRECLIKGFE